MINNPANFVKRDTRNNVEGHKVQVIHSSNLEDNDGISLGVLLSSGMIQSLTKDNCTDSMCI